MALFSYQSRVQPCRVPIGVVTVWFVMVFWVASLSAQTLYPRVVCIGDSITHGDCFNQEQVYRYHLYNLMVLAGYEQFDFVGVRYDTHCDAWHTDEWDINHEGYPGATAGTVAGYMANNAYQYQATLALIHLGTNDSRGGGSASSVTGGISQIIYHLRQSYPQVQVVVAQIIPTRSESNNVHIRGYNQAILSMAANLTTSQSPVITVDMYTDFDPFTMLYDEFHSNVAGSIEMAERWYVAMQAFLSPPPPVPTNVQAVYNTVTGCVELSWQDNAHGIDQESGFYIERKPHDGLDAWHRLASLDPDSVSYIDTSPVYGSVQYTYRIGAFRD